METSGRMGEVQAVQAGAQKLETVVLIQVPAGDPLTRVMTPQPTCERL